MLPRNSDQGFRYNGRNSVDPSAVSEGQMIDPSIQNHGALSNNSLPSTLASVTLENQNRVCKSLLVICSSLNFLLRIAILCGFL